MTARLELPSHALWMGLSVLLGLSTGCGSEESAPRARPGPSGPSAESPSPERPAEPPSPEPPARSEPATRQQRGAFYSILLPADATRAEPSAPEIVEAVWVIAPAEGVVLTVFRPMPEQNDLETWTSASERILEGIPARHDETELSGMPARVGVFPGELRWTVVADGNGLLFRCFSPDPHDEAWMRARCEEAVNSVELVRPIQ